MTGLVAGIAAVCALVVCGWRYGVTPLPQPVLVDQVVPFTPPTWTELTTNHCWYWFRWLRREVEVDGPAARDLLGAVEVWARWGSPGAPSWAGVLAGADAFEVPSGLNSATNYVAFRAWLQAHPAVERGFAAVLQTRDPTRPEPVLPDDARSANLIASLPIWLAGESERAGQRLTAFQYLVTAWRLQTLFTPNLEFADLFDEREDEQVNETLARPWRRLALTGPPLTTAAGKKLLANLAEVTNALPTCEAAYRRTFTPHDAGGAFDPQRPQVRLALASLGRVAKIHLLNLYEHTSAWLFGIRSATEAPMMPGRMFLGRPLRELLEALEAAVARPGDVQQVRRAFLSEQIRRLRAGALSSGATDPARPTLTPLVRWLRVWFDRPAVWRSLEDVPGPEMVSESLKRWRLYLESCRLTLALRLYHDLHGAWPDRLTQLIPDILPTVPLDPFTGEPLRYQRTLNQWVFWSRGGSAERESEPDAQAGPQRAFSSVEGWLAPQSAN